MSGICGILRLDGAPPAGIEAMCHRLRLRGPEGQATFRDGPVALGHTLLATTPEAAVERLPLTHAPTGCTITADVRLDNRDDLLVTLGLTQQGRTVGDAEIVLHAWLRWGEGCLTHLQGDFAFAIWDPRTRRLFCARDQIGMRQLIWTHVPGRLFAFATDPRAVLEAQGVPRILNEGRIADAIIGYLQLIDPVQTFFEGVNRLPAAHRLIVSDRGVDVARYWSLEPAGELRLPSDRAYEEAFLDVFRTSVRRRLRGAPGTVGSMLSGGMDSGSICATASRLMEEAGQGPFPTFSVVNPDPAACKETRTLLVSLTMPNLRPTVINTGDLGPWIDDLTASADATEEPFDLPYGVTAATYVAARRQGVKVVMSGIGGDFVMAAPTWIARLLSQGRWRDAWAECRGEEHFWAHGATARESLARALREWAMPTPVRRLREVARPGRVPESRLVNTDFARAIDLPGRIARYHRQDPWFWQDWGQDRVRSMTTLAMVTGLESYDRAAGTCGMEPRDPFLDLDVVRFCLALPGGQLQRDGWPKHLLRRAMAEYMPDTVRWRTGKEHVGPQMRVAGFARAGITPASLFDLHPALDGHVAPQVLADAGQQNGPMIWTQDNLRLWALGRWMTQATNMNDVSKE
jgi:asparagine synthase (glutamine-hydrolysing)